MTTEPEITLCRIVTDLTIEGDVLDELVSRLDDAGWRTPTPAEGWDVAHQVAHLAWTDEVALKAAIDKEAWDDVVLQAIDNPEGFVDAEADRLASLDPADLLERWRTGRAALADALLALPEGTKLPWFGPPMSAKSMATARFMETWAHGLDVAEALGAPPSVTDCRASSGPHDHEAPDGAVSVTRNSESGGVSPCEAKEKFRVRTPRWATCLTRSLTSGSTPRASWTSSECAHVSMNRAVAIEVADIGGPYHGILWPSG